MSEMDDDDRSVLSFDEAESRKMQDFIKDALRFGSDNDDILSGSDDEGKKIKSKQSSARSSVRNSANSQSVAPSYDKRQPTFKPPSQPAPRYKPKFLDISSDSSPPKVIEKTLIKIRFFMTNLRQRKR